MGALDRRREKVRQQSTARVWSTTIGAFLATGVVIILSLALGEVFMPWVFSGPGDLDEWLLIAVICALTLSWGRASFDEVWRRFKGGTRGDTA